MNLIQGVVQLQSQLNGSGLRIGIVVGRFNHDIGEGLVSSCSAELIRLGVKPADITVATVPGALEIPLVLQTMARSGRFDALVALGAVIRGETYHFEFVSNESCAGITRLQLDTSTPIANGILTTENDEQALERMHPKGVDCAGAVVEMVNLLRALK